MTELIDLQDRLRDVIKNTCNFIGCKACGLKWEGGCSSTDLQEKIMVIEQEAYDQIGASHGRG